jgi:hypothetical protein
MMRFMRILGALVGCALLAGELARAIAGPRAGPALQAAGWALFTGVMLATLGVNLDAWLTDTAKPRAGLYSGALLAMLGAGAAATLWWARRR